MFQSPHIQPQLHVGLVLADSFGSFRPVCVKLCVLGSRNSVSRKRQIEFFLYLSLGDFLEIDDFYSIFEHFGNFFQFLVLYLLSVIPCYLFPLCFLVSSLNLEQRNETLKSLNYIIKQ